MRGTGGTPSLLGAGASEAQGGTDRDLASGAIQ